MRIVVTEPLIMDSSVKLLLESIGDVVYGPFGAEELPQLLLDCDVLMIRLGQYIGEGILRNAPRLSYIVSATTGLDHIDLDAAEKAGIRIISLRDCMTQIQNVSATAEHTWGLLLALIRRLPAAVNHVAKGGWDRDLFWGTQLNGKQIGIVGYGRIGRMVANYAVAFGMQVVAYDQIRSNIVRPARHASLDELFSTSDVITIHVASDHENYHFIGPELIGIVKRGAYLLNTSRGLIVDSAALADALKSGALAGVAVDVIEGEEHEDIGSDPILACSKSGENVLITPHIGGATRESIALTEFAVVSELKNQCGST